MNKNKEYMNNFVKKNENKIKESSICEVCGGSYKYFNKSHHKRSAKHLKILQIKNEHRNILDDLLLKQNNIML